MKRFFTSLKYFIYFCLVFIIFPVAVQAEELFSDNQLYFFYGQGCSHCAQVEQFFDQYSFYDRYNIVVKEVYFDQTNAVLFQSLLDEREIPISQRGVPALITANQTLIGDQEIIDHFAIAVESTVVPPADQQEEPEADNKQASLSVGMVIAGSLVDAINPCAFAVLIILMSAVLARKDSKNALKSGVAFSIAIFISYVLMGIGLYSALGLGKFGQTFFKVIGWLAIFLGLLNLKDSIWYGKGVLMEVPLSWRPRLKQLIHSATTVKGSFFIGFLVSLFLLPCTSGPYLVVLGMLAQTTTRLPAFGYLILYNLVFISPMIIISYLVYRGYDPKKAEAIRKKRLRVLHFIAGIIMLVMGGLLLFFY